MERKNLNIEVSRNDWRKITRGKKVGRLLTLNVEETPLMKHLTTEDKKDALSFAISEQMKRYCDSHQLKVKERQIQYGHDFNGKFVACGSYWLIPATKWAEENIANTESGAALL